MGAYVFSPSDVVTPTTYYYVVISFDPALPYLLFIRLPADPCDTVHFRVTTCAHV